MLKAIFFDFNGVIIDDETLQMKAYQDVLREHEIPLTQEWYLDALGMDDKTFVRYAFDRAKKPISDDTVEGVLQAKTRVHRGMIEDELPLFPGVVGLIKSVSRDLMLGLVSMACENEISYVLNRASLASYFKVVVKAGDVSACKPAPDCYRFGLDRLNETRQRKRLLPLLPAECVAIEDSPPGIQSAKAVGMHTIGVTNTVAEAALRSAGAEVVTKDLSDWTTDAFTLLFG